MVPGRIIDDQGRQGRETGICQVGLIRLVVVSNCSEGGEIRTNFA